MAFCESNNTAGAPAAAGGMASPASAVPKAAATPSSVLPSFKDVIKNQIPPGMQMFLGSVGVDGFPSLTGNKPTTVTGMASPGAQIPMMEDPAKQQGKGKTGNL